MAKGFPTARDNSGVGLATANVDFIDNRRAGERM